jgi:CSLREA domain-containing protein
MKYRSIYLGLIVFMFLCVVMAFVLVKPAGAGTTINVNTIIDELNTDGDCSLREAIRAANLDTAVDACLAGSGADTILIPSGLYTLTLAGTDEDRARTGDLDITDDLSLSGSTASDTVINGNGIDRVLQITGTTTSTVTISNLTIKGGSLSGPNTLGGGIYTKGHLTIINSVVADNLAGFQGGGIYNLGTLNLVNSTLSGNAADGGGGLFSWNGIVNITSSTFISNTAAHSGGGGIRSAYSTITLVNSTVMSNTTSHGNGGGISKDQGIMTISQSHIIGNRITSALLYGGGIYNSGVLTITYTTINGNFTQGDSINGGGGGIFTNGSLSLVNSTLSENSTGGGGGGIMSNSNSHLRIRKTTFSNNSAFNGGGLYSRGVITVTNSTFSGNRAMLSGGGIYDALETSTVSLSNVTLTNNMADALNVGFGDGGGISHNFGFLLAQNSIIAGNTDAGGQAPDCSGELTSHGYNLIQSTTGCIILGDATGNLTGVSPQLGPLQNNGGATFTHALLPGSPAIDAGRPSGCTSWLGDSLTFDQRRFPRPTDGGSGTARCDIGAFELSTLFNAYLPILLRNP